MVKPFPQISILFLERLRIRTIESVKGHGTMTQGNTSSQADSESSSSLLIMSMKKQFEKPARQWPKTISATARSSPCGRSASCVQGAHHRRHTSPAREGTRHDAPATTHWNEGFEWLHYSCSYAHVHRREAAPAINGGSKPKTQ
jgi:hypothetical protein